MGTDRFLVTLLLVESVKTSRLTVVSFPCWKQSWRWEPFTSRLFHAPTDVLDGKPFPANSFLEQEETEGAEAFRQRIDARHEDKATRYDLCYVRFLLDLFLGLGDGPRRSSPKGRSLPDMGPKGRIMEFLG